MENWLSKYRRSYSHLLSVAIISSLLVFGFDATSVTWIRTITLVVIGICTLISLRFLALMYRYGGKTHMALFFLFVLALSLLARGLWGGILSEALLFLYFVGLFFYLSLQTPILKETRESFQSAPAVFCVDELCSFGGTGIAFSLSA